MPTDNSTAPNALAGTCYVTIDGVSYDIVGEGSYQCSGGSREALNGQNGFHGYKEKPMPGNMKWKGRNSSAVAIAALNGCVNSSVVFELINGKTIIGRNMFRNGEPITVDTEEGEFDLEFTGKSVTEN
jgi:hypothetical protein